MGAMSQSNCNRYFRRQWLLALGGLALAGGCDRDADVHTSETSSMSGAPASVMSTTAPSESETRFEAAIAITDTKSRDSALQEVAEFSAERNQVDVVRKALDRITNTSDRDAATARAALGLTRTGNTPAAMEMAGRIIDATQRDTALAKIAKGQTN